MKKHKKIFLIVLVIFILVLLFVLCRFLFIYDAIKTSNKLQDLTNFYFLDTYSNFKIEYWKKDNIIIRHERTDTSDITFWRNFDTDDGLMLYNMQKSYSLNENLLHETLIPASILAGSSVSECFFNPSFHISLKKYNDKTCYFIKTKHQESYVDKETGIMVYSQSDGSERNVQFSLNTVTDEDIQRPDTTGYTLQSN